MSRVVVLGAGLTGLSTVYHLEKLGFEDVVLFEQHESHGGLARSVQHDGFTFDYTGHLIHINDPYFQKFINTVMGPDSLDHLNRHSYVYSHNRYTHYPFQMNLHGQPSEVVRDCIHGFVTRKKVRSPKTFHEWVLTHFGAGLGKHFFFPYNTKQLAYDLRKVDPGWVGRFVPKTDLNAFLRGALEPTDTSVGYNKTFCYPKKGGIQALANGVANQLTTPITTRSRVASVDLKNKTVHLENGRSERFEVLVTTLPLDTFLRLSTESSSSSLSSAQRYLKCNAVINFNLGLNVADVGDKHWVYFPEETYPFYRLGFWHNFSSSMAPPGCTAVYGEISHMPGSRTKDHRPAIEKAIDKTLAVLGLNASNVITRKILHLPHAYVIYNGWRKKNLHRLQSRLENMGVYSVGRFGSWKYSSMQEAILDGRETAQTCFARLKKLRSSTLIPARLDKKPSSTSSTPIPNKEKRRTT